MKTNEAPEKIYIQLSVIEQLPHQNFVYTKPLTDNSIEYTRTDVFIEKACKWLEENADTYIGVEGYAMLQDGFFEHFRKAMED